MFLLLKYWKDWCKRLRMLFGNKIPNPNSNLSALSQHEALGHDITSKQIKKAFRQGRQTVDITEQET